MIVRESPRRGRIVNEPAWPPKSPSQAAYSSPSGRKRIESLLHRRAGSTSPSPSKRRKPSPPSDAEDDDEEDEETLQLKLQRIEAQLKLKKLQRAKENISPDGSLRAAKNDVSRARVEVPTSPKKTEPVVAVSPRRVQLGIDKGLKASQVSLKRPAQSRPARILIDDPVRRRDPLPAPKSFSERLAEARDQDRSREERQSRYRENKSSGFGLREPQKPSDGVRPRPIKALSPGTDPSHDRGIFRHNSTCVPRKDGGNTLERSKSLSDMRKTEDSTSASSLIEHDPFSGFDLSRRHIQHNVLDKAFRDKTLFRLPEILKQVKAPDYEPPDVDDDFVIFATVASKSSPKDHAPTHKQTSTADEDDDPSKQRKKFMVLHLTDYKWELDLFLFDAAFDAFWKLTVGSVIAILNPGIMPPKPHMRDTGQFSLKLACSEDALIEIGMAKHIGWCKSVKKDGEKCGQWVDTRKTEFCDFHVNLQFEKTRANRPEISSMAGMGMFEKKSQRGGAAGRFARGSGKSASGKAGSVPGGAKYGKDKKPWVEDWEARHEVSFAVPRGARMNAAKLLDADDYGHGETPRERAARREQQRKNELKLLAQLSTQGSGQGSEYARMKSTHSATEKDRRGGGGSTDANAFERPRADLDALGLAGGTASAVKLSPVKGGKYKGLSSTGDQMGWGGANKRDLLEPTRGVSPLRKVLKSGDSLQSRELSPSKQARFKLPDKKGLRIPGRESLPKAHGYDDDDDLDIV